MRKILAVCCTAHAFGLSVTPFGMSGTRAAAARKARFCSPHAMMAPADEGECDFLVIGAGANGMTFVDSMLLANPECKIVVVDRHEMPGGHWTVAYDHVKLHHTSIVYGLESTKLEGSWSRLALQRRMLPWDHCATKRELLDYYAAAMERWCRAGSVRYFPCSAYDFSQLQQQDNVSGERLHCWSSLVDSREHRIVVRHKLVDGARGECRVPSECPLDIPVDPRVALITPNELSSSSVTEAARVVVLGAGKTAMDAVLQLQRLGVPPQRVTWVIAADGWMLNRAPSTTLRGSTKLFAQALLRCDGDTEAAYATLEQEGHFLRLDSSVTPTRFRFPTVDLDELERLRRVHDVVRRGRVARIDLCAGAPTLAFGDGQPPLNLPAGSLLVHCASPGPLHAATGRRRLFESDGVLNLGHVFQPPVPVSVAALARLEAARVDSTLDLAFGRDVTGLQEENDVLDALFTNYDLSPTSTDHLRPIINLASFVCLLDPDPAVAVRWLRNNRLSLYRNLLPFQRLRVCEDVGVLLEKSKVLGLRADEVRQLRQMHQTKLGAVRGE